MGRSFEAIVSISDVHIREKGDISCQLFLGFLNHEKTNRADVVVLLGDIFDLMVGPYTEYIEKFRSIFDRLDHLAKKKEYLLLSGESRLPFNGYFF